MPDTPAQPTGYGNRILFLLKDNFSLGNIYQIVQEARMGDTLQAERPVTFMAIPNQAIISWYWLSYAEKRRWMQYLIIPGAPAFRQLPLTENRAMLTTAASNIYITRFMRGNDTVTTVNGVELLAVDNPAGNGFLQVLGENINVENEPTVMHAIHNDSTVVLFAAALQRAGLTDSLADARKTWTVLAPVNTAFIWSASQLEGLDLSSLDKILSADPERLKAVLRYHLAEGRLFTGSLYRMAAANNGTITMRDGSRVSISGNQAIFNNITFRGKHNSNVAQIAKYPNYGADPNYANIPCENGVLHKITSILIP
ncbi:fasciclin domain-containing protein [Chitinophaga pendula]|uniref:fasciclin domain-containing protein n=1 Tax=Chitinophaga TaxID=79328 RepID=UPI0012FE44EF|nr:MULTISPECIES: fasciclin domain-containing protein [Chitinophaga]UCJ04812.1 fasciclin domain-containing protein [Chitinophaga pendula]